MQTDKSESLKANIKTQPGERYSDMVAFCVPLFWMGSPEAPSSLSPLSTRSSGARIYPRDPKILGWHGTWSSENPCKCLNRRLNKGGQKETQNMSWWWITSSSNFSLLRRSSARRGTSGGGCTNPATPKADILFVASARWSSTSRSSLLLDRYNAYQKTISSSW